jgi:hypothetical protein
MNHGVEVTRLGATDLDAEVVGWTINVVQRGC